MRILVPALLLLLIAPDFAAERLSESPLDEKLIAFIGAHPDVSLPELAREANRLLNLHGIDFRFFAEAENNIGYDGPGSLDPFGSPLPDVDIRGMIVPTVIAFSGEQGRFITHADFGFTGPCGEVFVSAPIIRLTADSALLATSAGPVWTKRPPGLSLDTVYLLATDGEPVLLAVETPISAMEPIGARADRKAIYFKYLMGESAENWWHGVRARHQLLAGEARPFVVLEISADGMRFVGDIQAYTQRRTNILDAQSTEDAPHFPGGGYGQMDRFDDTGLIVEHQSECT